MVLLLLAPALAANPPAYHRRALVELDNLDLGNGHSRAQAASLFHMVFAIVLLTKVHKVG